MLQIIFHVINSFTLFSKHVSLYAALNSVSLFSKSCLIMLQIIFHIINSFTLFSKHVSLYAAPNSVSFSSKSCHIMLHILSHYSQNVSHYAAPNSVSLFSDYVSHAAVTSSKAFLHAQHLNDLRRKRTLKRAQSVDIFVRFYQNLDVSTERSQAPDCYAAPFT